MKTTLALCTALGLLALPAIAAQSDQISASRPADRPAKVIQTLKPQFPAVMLHSAIKEGAAQVLVEVSDKGEVADVLATAYSNAAFADEAKRVVREWHYEPAQVDGQPAAAIVPLSFKFELQGILIVASRESAPPTGAPAARLYAYEAEDLRGLDRIPTPVKIVSPTYPQEWAHRGLTGKVTVDFYIDETGHVRMASCPEGTDHQLAGIALAAVSAWEFTPPTSNGRPVLVCARQVFNFVEKTATEANP